MKYLPQRWMMVPSGTLLFASMMFAVTPNAKTFEAGQKFDVKGVIISREGDVLKVRGDDDSVGSVDLTNTTKIELKHGILGRKTAMDTGSLVPGLHIEAKGMGSDKGDLVADRVIFDPNSMRASRQIDARVSPLEAKEGSLENRAGTLENRAGQMEGRQTDLENTQKQTQQQVGQVKVSADQANQGVSDVNTRVGNLDNYDAKYSTIVYFRTGSSILTPEAKQELDDIATKAKSEKGYVVEVAGYADTTGNQNRNQALSQQRADATIQYLEEQGDIPIHRILTPTGLGTSHEAADNSTTSGRKLNRRVEVKVLVNQGLVSSNPGSSNGATGTSTSGSPNTGTPAPTTPAPTTPPPPASSTPPPAPQQ